MAYRQFIADVAADPELPPVDAANGDVLGDDDFTSRVTNRPPIPRPAGLTLEELVKERAASLSQVARFLRRDRATLRYAMRQHAGSLE